MKQKIMLFIPVFNCEKQIVRVIKQFSKSEQQKFVEIIIIDNNSRDKTIIAAEQAARKILQFCNIKILKNKENYGLGGSIKLAFNYAISKNYNYMVTLHGDDQANILDAIKIIQSKVFLKYDMCIGARFSRGSLLNGYSKIRIIGNKVLNFLLSKIAKRRIDDLVAGLNIYNVDLLRSKFYYNFPDDLTFDVHFLLYMIYKKKKFYFFPLTWREFDQVSNAKVLQQAFVIIKLLIKYFYNKDFLNKLISSDNCKMQKDAYDVVFTKRGKLND